MPERFSDRSQAGHQLAQKLRPTFDGAKNTIVIGLPRGGIVVADRISQELGLPMDTLIIRLITQPTTGVTFGAVSEVLRSQMDWRYIDRLKMKRAHVDTLISHAQGEVNTLRAVFRGIVPPKSVTNTRVLLVDDGTSTESMLHSAAYDLRLRGARELVLGIPVVSQAVIGFLKSLEYGRNKALIKDVVTIKTPRTAAFRSVNDFYEPDGLAPVPIETILEILKRQRE